MNSSAMAVRTAAQWTPRGAIGSTISLSSARVWVTRWHPPLERRCVAEPAVVVGAPRAGDHQSLASAAGKARAVVVHHCVVAAR